MAGTHRRPARAAPSRTKLSAHAMTTLSTRSYAQALRSLHGVRLTALQHSNTGTGNRENDHASKHDQETKIHLSTMFYPGSPGFPESLVNEKAITALVSSDGVFFYVHSKVLIAASSNGFGGSLPPPWDIGTAKPNLMPIPESAEIINILLHAIYDLDISAYNPSLPSLIYTIKTVFPRYGYTTTKLLSNNSALYNALLSHAPFRPLEVYAFAASVGSEDLAVACSSHLLSLEPHSITDEACIEMGPIYLKRLLFLHLGRVEALKRHLLPPPDKHPPTESCSSTDQDRLTSAWALATSRLICEARADTSAGMLENALSQLGNPQPLWCEKCREMLRGRIRKLVEAWDGVKKTI